MDDQVTRLLDKAWERFQQHPKDRRFLIAIAGIPGSGKTTLSEKITAQLNARHLSLHPDTPDVPAIAAFVPMDGYHLSRAQLSAMPDPVTAHARRGAEFTFDGAAYLKLIRALREPLSPSSGTIHAPSFDHAVKDPKERDIAILPSHRIIVLEGNYVLLNKEPWSSAAGLMDEKWFVHVDLDIARARLVRRHVRAGLAKDEEEAGRRADENDLVNGKEIGENKVDADEVVISREDGGWVHE